MSKQEKRTEQEQAHDNNVHETFPRGRKRFDLGLFFSKLEDAGHVKMEPKNDAKTMTFEEWVRTRPLRLND